MRAVLLKHFRIFIWSLYLGNLLCANDNSCLSAPGHKAVNIITWIAAWHARLLLPTHLYRGYFHEYKNKIMLSSDTYEVITRSYTAMIPLKQWNVFAPGDAMMLAMWTNIGVISSLLSR